MSCPSCGASVTEGINFCPSCGKRLSKDVPKSDFEIGKIAALDTIKSEIIKWFLTLAAIGGLIGFVGVREYVKTAVDSAVKSQLDSLSNQIEKASNDAEESTAKAKIESRQLDSTIDSLNDKASGLSKSIDAVGEEKGRLLAATQQLKKQQEQMVKATGDLEQKRKQLADIIEAENLTTVFAKLRSDFYRIHTLSARAEFFASAHFTKDLTEFFPFAQMSLSRTVNPGLRETVAQFRVVNAATPTAMYNGVDSSDASSLIYDYDLFDPFHRSLEGKPMKVLNGIDGVLLQYRTVLGGEQPAQKVENFRRFLAELSEVRIEILLNNVPIETHHFTKAELAVPEASAVQVKDATLLYDFQKNEPGAYKDTEALYGQAIAVNAQ